jgi:hypothetical protein
MPIAAIGEPSSHAVKWRACPGMRGNGADHVACPRAQSAHLWGMSDASGAGGEEAAETSGLAIASLFLGIIWLFGLGSILAIVLGYLGMKEVRESGGHTGGWAIALAGVIVGVVGLASLGILIGFLLSSAHNTPQLPGPGP